MKSLSKQSRKEAAASRKEDKPSIGLRQRAQNLQSRWADWMGSRTAHFQRKHWLIVLTLFVLLAGGYSVYLMLSSFQWKGRTLFSILPMHKPESFRETGEIEPNNHLLLPSGEYERIHRFRLYMDSLSASPWGKKAYDSILLYRPGLMDSVLFIEKHYRPTANN